VYALGLGIPFVVAGLAFTKMARAITFLRRRQLLIMRIGGFSMVIVGLLLVTGAWDTLTGALRQWAASFETVI
jgi:cytochrome c-type biogenesis protein